MRHLANYVMYNAQCQVKIRKSTMGHLEGLLDQKLGLDKSPRRAKYVLDQHSNGVAWMEADNDDIFFSAPTSEDFDNLSKTLIEAWQVASQNLDHV